MSLTDRVASAHWEPHSPGCPVPPHSPLTSLLPAPAQVMQFGRIDGNAYILDFQYPFSAVQAFAVALANVTQRLK